MAESDQDTYYQLYRDYGWEAVATCNSFEIFRRPANHFEEDDLFSDGASRWEMVRQIFMRRFLVLLATTVVLLGLGFYYR